MTAGSERASNTDNRGQRLTEGAMINRFQTQSNPNPNGIFIMRFLLSRIPMEVPARAGELHQCPAMWKERIRAVSG